MVYQSAIDALLAQARAVLDRVEPGRIDEELAAGAVLIDIRPVEQRQRDLVARLVVLAEGVGLVGAARGRRDGAARSSASRNASVRPCAPIGSFQ